MRTSPAGGRGDAGEGADLDHPLVEQERPGDRAQHRFGGEVGARQLARVEGEGDRELVAAQAGDHRVGAERFVERGGDARAAGGRPSRSRAGR